MGAGATTGCSSLTVTSTGRLTMATTARRPVTVLARRSTARGAHRMARSVATAIREGNRNGPHPLDDDRAWDYDSRSMLDTVGRAPLLHVVIWLATLFFAVMLFLPLVREAMRRVTELSPGGPY